MKSKSKPLPALLKQAQIVFNSFIRHRDKDKGCISCGGSVDHAGHYLNQGQHSAHRFSELNVNGQCVGCNCYKHGNLIRYRQGLVKRYGEDAVLKLENEPKTAHRWSREELENIIEHYKIN
jgi:hypothetical protein